MRKRSVALSLGLGIGLGLGVAGSALALPPIGPAFEADTPIPVQDDMNVYDIGVATDGERLFTVFEEGGNIRGMLTDASGHALFSKMPYYAEAPDYEWNTHPSLAFGDSQYLVAYSSTPGIFVLRVDVDGQTVGEPIQLSETGYSPTVGWLGDKFVVAWYDSDGITREIASATVTNTGEAGETQVLSVNDSAGEPTIAANASGALVSWINHGTYEVIGVEAVLLDTNGELSVPEFSLQTGGSGYEQRVATIGDDFLVVWSADTGVRGVAVNDDGTVSEVLDIGQTESSSSVAIGANADGYLVAWLQYGAEEPVWKYRHISATGELEGGGPAPILSSSYEFALLGNDDGYWAVYRNAGLWGAFTDADLTPLGEPSPLSLIENSQETHELFWNGQSYVLLWDDDRFGRWTYSGRMARVNTSGERLDADSIWLDEGGYPGFNYAATPLADGKTLVVWAPTDPRNAYTRIVNADGTLTETLDLGPTTASIGVSMAEYGGQHLLIYSDASETYVGQLFDANGARLGSPRPLPVPSGTYDVRVYTGAAGFLLQVGGYGGTGMATLRADWTLGEIQFVQGGTFPIDVAVGGGKTAVVWSYFSGQRVARFWDGDGWAGDEFTLGQDAQWGDVVWDGTQFAAAWQDSDYYGHWTTFDVDGNVAPSEQLFDGDECNGPMLGSNGAGQVMLSCVRYNRDYSRRIVSYMVESGAGSGNPGGGTSSDGGSSTASDVTLPDGETISEGDASTDGVAYPTYPDYDTAIATTELPPTSESEATESAPETSSALTTTNAPSSEPETTEPATSDVASTTSTTATTTSTTVTDTTSTSSSASSSTSTSTTTDPTTSTNPTSSTSTSSTSTGSGGPPPKRGCNVSPQSRGDLGGLPFLMLAGAVLARRARRRA